LYSSDPLHLELCLDFWTASNQSANTTTEALHHNQTLTQKQLSLFKFVRYFLSADILSTSLYIAYIHLLTGLSTGAASAHHAFLFLQHNAHFYDAHTPHHHSQISFNHILNAFERYYDFFKNDPILNTASTSAVAGCPVPMKSLHHNKSIGQAELQGLVSVCRLVANIVRHNETIRQLLFDYQYADSTQAYTG
jgi:hypothetical protein